MLGIDQTAADIILYDQLLTLLNNEVKTDRAIKNITDRYTKNIKIWFMVCSILLYPLSYIAFGDIIIAYASAVILYIVAKFFIKSKYDNERSIRIKNAVYNFRITCMLNRQYDQLIKLYQEIPKEYII